MNTLEKTVTASAVAQCNSITPNGTGYAADCTFVSVNGPIEFNDHHEHTPKHVLKVKTGAAVQITFSIDQTALPTGYSSVSVSGITLPPDSPLQIIASNILLDPNPGPSTAVYSYSLVLQATPSGGKPAISATWDPGIENDGPPC